MSIEEFVSQFNDIIPYKFSIKIGGARATEIKLDKSKGTNQNYKGKMYPYYKKDIMGTKVDYFPIEQIDVPIEVSIECRYPHRLKWEKFSKTTNKETTDFQVRLLKENEDRQFGYVSLDLTPSGDLKNKFCSYYNEDGTKEIRQFVFYNFNESTKEITANEHLSYVFYDLETGMEEQVEFFKTNRKLQGIAIHKSKLKDHQFDSIVWGQEEVNEKECMFSRCFSERLLERINPTCDVTNSIINQDFIYRRNRIKELHRLMQYEKDETKNHMFNFRWFKQELRELLNPKNDIFRGFVGSYIGNTIIKKGGQILLVVETIKDGLHYFTQVDITNTHAFDVDIYRERYDSTLYHKAIINASKMPMFRIKIENGEEILVPFGEAQTEKEIQSFQEFKSYCIESFASIENKKLSTLSLRQNQNIEPSGGPKLNKKRKYN